MATRPAERIGVIYGDVESTRYKFAANATDVRRNDYVAAQHPSGLTLGQVVDIQRHSHLSFEEAVSLGAGTAASGGDPVSCQVRVIGFRDERGLLQNPRTPFKTGTEVLRAPAELVAKVLGLTTAKGDGVYLGFLKGTDVPVVLDPQELVQKHVSVLAKTGAGKSYTVGVLIEEMLKQRVPLIIVDPHGEYGTLSSPNIESGEIDNLVRFGLRPKSFADKVVEYTTETGISPGAKHLALDGAELEATELMELLASKVTSAQQGLLYQAINALKKSKPGYQLEDILQELSKSPSNAKWPLVAAVENLQNTDLFSTTGINVQELIAPARASILNLKGTPPQMQQIIVARLARALFDARKRANVPPFLMVVEEAHNFCPERGIATALSGPELRTIASEGRKFGMGLLIVSQRPAKVDKNVLSQCNTQIIMKVTNPNDLKAISQSVEGLTGDAADEIQRLGTGVAVVAGGPLASPILVEVRTRQTRHGGRSVNVIVDEDLGDEPVPSAADQAGDEAHQGGSDDDAYVKETPGPDEPLEPVFSSPNASAADASPPAPAQGKDAGEGSRLREAAAHTSTKDAPWGPQIALPRPEDPEPPVAEHPRPFPKATRDQDLPDPKANVIPNLEPDDSALHRVLGRVGYEAASTRDALQAIRDQARQVPIMTADAFVRRFARVGRTYCLPSLPECGPCPLLHHCRVGRRRLADGEVREGQWGKKR